MGGSNSSLTERIFSFLLALGVVVVGILGAPARVARDFDAPRGLSLIIFSITLG